MNRLLAWMWSQLSPGCPHRDRMAPRFDYDSGKFLETCLGCGQRVASDFTMDTKLYYALRPKVEPVDIDSQDVATLLDRSRKT